MKHRFTWIELLVVIVIIVVSLAILIPVLNSHRRGQRRAVCRNNSQRIRVVGFANYASTFNGTFPPLSVNITKAPDSSNGTVDGSPVFWSNSSRLWNMTIFPGPCPCPCLPGTFTWRTSRTRQKISLRSEKPSSSRCSIP